MPKKPLILASVALAAVIAFHILGAAGVMESAHAFGRVAPFVIAVALVAHIWMVYRFRARNRKH